MSININKDNNTIIISNDLNYAVDKELLKTNLINALNIDTNLFDINVDINENIPVTQPAVTEPPVTQPPVTQPAVKPAVTEPPVTEPPVTEPPVTQPPVTQPPVTEPPVTQPAVKPAVTQPPVTQPPVTQPPVTQPPVTQPPVTQPPVTQPPVTQPPVTQPAVTQPPVTQPPVTQPAVKPAVTTSTISALPSYAPAPVTTTAKPTIVTTTAAPVVTQPSIVYPVCKNRYYEFHVLKRRTGTQELIQMSELKFFDINKNYIPTVAFPIVNPGGINPTLSPFIETPDKLIDNSLDTKWLDFTGPNTTANSAGYIKIDFGADYMNKPLPEYYTWYTANDAPDRDPVSWFVKSVSDATDTCYKYDEINNYPVAVARKYDVSFGFYFRLKSIIKNKPANIDNYRYYQWRITKRRGVDNGVQVSKLYLYDKNKVQIDMSSYVLTNPQGTSPIGYTADKLIDTNLLSKWFTYILENALYMYGAVINLDRGIGFSSKPAPYYYNWITAEDAPNRDPISWVFYGSNDSFNWFLLNQVDNSNVTTNRNTLISIQPLQLMYNIQLFENTLYNIIIRIIPKATATLADINALESRSSYTRLDSVFVRKPENIIRITSPAKSTSPIVQASLAPVVQPDVVRPSDVQPSLAPVYEASLAPNAEPVKTTTVLSSTTISLNTYIVGGIVLLVLIIIIMIIYKIKKTK